MNAFDLNALLLEALSTDSDSAVTDFLRGITEALGASACVLWAEEPHESPPATP